MHVSRNTARDVLLWLEETDWLTRHTQTITPEGRLPDARYLVVPIVQHAASPLDAANPKPASKTGEASVQNEGTHHPKRGTPASNGHIPALDNTLDNLSYLDTQPPIFRTPQEILEEARNRKRAAESVA
jgi:hypothetical protein